MALAIFDLDNTLLNGDSDHAWGEFLVTKGVVDDDVYKAANDHFYQQYQSGGLDIDEYLQFALEPLTRFSMPELAELHQEFMRTVIEPMFLEQAHQLLQKHRDAGDFLLIITATNAFVTHPIGRALGVDAILATDPEIVAGQYTGRYVGFPCFQYGKVERLLAWLTETGHSLEGSYFYSDSHNDLPLLEMVDFPYAVDADDTLKEHAEAEGWPIISLRDA
ncbi:putative phosphatase [BD1-7 clade bacterium]|nr:putative phosphatase [BD1-7 clade bacterium]